jgi:hypothetical protein
MTCTELRTFQPCLLTVLRAAVGPVFRLAPIIPGNE